MMGTFVIEGFSTEERAPGEMGRQSQNEPKENRFIQKSKAECKQDLEETLGSDNGWTCKLSWGGVWTLKLRQW